LKDLESVDLRVKPTSHVNDHLRLEGNTLNILKVDFEELNMLGAYKDNKAAKYFFFTRSHSCLLMLNSFIERWGLQVLEKKSYRRCMHFTLRMSSGIKLKLRGFSLP